MTQDGQVSFWRRVWCVLNGGHHKRLLPSPCLCYRCGWQPPKQQ